MRAVLPGSSKPVPSRYIQEIVGPRIEAFHATQEVLQSIRAVELGSKDIPVLPIDAGNNTLILNHPDWKSEEVLHNWYVLRLGMFSTCPVHYVNCSSAQRTENRGIIARLSAATAAQLMTLMVTEEEEEEEGVEDRPQAEPELPQTELELPEEEEVTYNLTAAGRADLGQPITWTTNAPTTGTAFIPAPRRA